MWAYTGNDLKMAEGDFGIGLTIIVNGVDFTDQDVIKLTFKKAVNDQNVILEKTYTPVNNTIELEFTAEESALFQVGNYVYAMDWYRGSELLCNVTPVAYFKVVDKV